jgi:hypothetical protein
MGMLLSPRGRIQIDLPQNRKWLALRCCSYAVRSLQNVGLFGMVVVVLVAMPSLLKSWSHDECTVKIEAINERSASTA